MMNAWLLTQNTLKVLLRKKTNILIFFILPIVGMLVSIVAYGNMGLSYVHIGVVDNDRTTLARDYIQSLIRQQTFKVTSLTEAEKENQISSDKVECVLVIPEGFAEEIYHQNLKPVEIFSIRGKSTTAWIENYTNIYLKNLQDIAHASDGNQDVFQKIYNNLKQDPLVINVKQVQDQTHNKEMTTQMIGFLILFMLLGAGNAAEMILTEKRNRTYHRICAAPVTSRIYILGNIMANLILIMLQIALTLIIMIKIFKVQVNLPVFQFYLILTLFGLVAIGLGVLIVAFSNDSKQAGTMQNLIITPSCMLAGCFWPVDIMPKTLQRIADFLPQTWTISAIQKLQMGESLVQVLSNLLILAAFAVTFFLIAAYKFGRNDNIKTFV